MNTMNTNTMNTNETMNEMETPEAVLKSAIEKMKDIREYLNVRYIDRGMQIEMLLSAAIAGENAVLIGPGGTAKSMLIRDVIAFLSPDRDWFYQFSPFTTTKDVIGVLDTEEMLKTGARKVYTKGRITDPRVAIAGCDEIFKTSPEVFDSLMMILNEREALLEGDDVPRHLHLESVFAASNELPHGFGGRRKAANDLAAFWDRWVIRGFIEDNMTIEDLVNLARMQLAQPPRPDSLTDEERHALMEAAWHVSWNDKNALFQAKELATNKGLAVSTRRVLKLLHVARSHAMMEGRTTCGLGDYKFAIKVGFWTDTPDLEKVAEILPELGSKADQALADWHTELQNVTEEWHTDAQAAQSLTDFNAAAAQLKAEGKLIHQSFVEINKEELSEPQAYEEAKQVLENWKNERAQEYSEWQARFTQSEELFS